uniref:EF-hand calcium-binding domain-containing protein 6 n=1 Tax=Lygus hesperus TaxID=30085 RepID=A0A0A9X5Y2_LYGHE
MCSSHTTQSVEMTFVCWLTHLFAVVTHDEYAQASIQIVHLTAAGAMTPHCDLVCDHCGTTTVGPFTLHLLYYVTHYSCFLYQSTSTMTSDQWKEKMTKKSKEHADEA